MPDSGIQSMRVHLPPSVLLAESLWAMKYCCSGTHRVMVYRVDVPCIQVVAETEWCPP